MALNIKSTRVEQLVDEVAALTGESKTEAVRQALEERRARLALRGLANDRYDRFMYLLERDIWPAVPLDELGARAITKEEEEEILGLGTECG